jgi:hypothetical protein
VLSNEEFLGHKFAHTSTYDLYFSNKVKNYKLYSPVLFTFYMGRFSLDVGLHLKFKLSLDQVEDSVKKGINGWPDEVITHHNREQFRFLDIGYSSGVNIMLLKRFSISARIVQNFTTPGEKYAWLKSCNYQLSLNTIILGKALTPSKKDVPKDMLDYRLKQLQENTRSSQNIIRVEYKRVGKGNRASITLQPVDQQSTAKDVTLKGSNGIMSSNNGSFSFDKIEFPFSCRLTFIAESKISVTLDESTKYQVSTQQCFLDFELPEKGSWEITVFY